MWAEPDGEEPRCWASLPDGDEENVAAQIVSIRHRAAIAKFLWPIPDKGGAFKAEHFSPGGAAPWSERDGTETAATVGEKSLGRNR